MVTASRVVNQATQCFECGYKWRDSYDFSQDRVDHIMKCWLKVDDTRVAGLRAKQVAEERAKRKAVKTEDESDEEFADDSDELSAEAEEDRTPMSRGIRHKELLADRANAQTSGLRRAKRKAVRRVSKLVELSREVRVGCTVVLWTHCVLVTCER